MTDAEILATIRDRQRHGRKIGLCNGVYDLLHPGHVFFLEQAANRCDHLVVGLNDDDSARALNKGPGQPFLAYDMREMMLGALEVVGSVLPFDGDVERLIHAVKPDVIVRGRGQRLSELESEIQKDTPERVVWVIGELWSTTRTINAILGAHRPARSGEGPSPPSETPPEGDASQRAPTGQEEASD